MTNLWQTPVDWATGISSPADTVAAWTGLITSRHQPHPKFMTTVAAVVQPLADLITQLSLIPSLYDLDNAGGEQLDTVGSWVGASRYVQTPLVGVYFELDMVGVGFDQGAWFGPYDSVLGATRLGDDTFRTLIRAKILANHWDGTKPGAYAAWAALFSSTFTVLIQDTGAMHMMYALLGPSPDAVTLALFTQGYLTLKPSGVQIDAYMTPSVSSAPYFGFDAQNSAVAGFDTGAWGSVN